MYYLFLDVASSTGLLACSTEKHVVAHRSIDHRVGDHELVPLVEEVLKESRWSFSDLTHLACVIGPGGFTSLRVGVACINALAWTLKIPSTGIHLSDLYAARIAPSPQPPPPTSGRGGAPLSPTGGRGRGWGRLGIEQEVGAIWLHSTKRTELFIRGFGNFSKEWPNPTIISIGELLSKLQSPTTYPLQPTPYVGELLPEHRAVMEKMGAPPPLRPFADVLPPFLHSVQYQEQVLQPWYGRGW